MFESYRKHGIRTLPVKSDKSPMVKNWQNVPLDARWEDKYAGAGIGAICGEKITVVDVDDLSLSDMARERFGATPVEVRTRKGLHLYYRSNGERRRIKALGSDIAIDVLGLGGYVIVPDSPGYMFTKGGVEELPYLPTIAPGALPTVVDSQPRRTASGEASGRNDELYRAAIRLAGNAPLIEDLHDRVSERNAKFDAPLSNSEVKTVVASAWKAKQENRLFTAARPGVGVYKDELDLLRKHPDALTLFVDLRYNWGWMKGEAFNLANAAAGRYAMTLARFRDAWMTLEGLGFIEVVHPGGQGPRDPRRVRFI